MTRVKEFLIGISEYFTRLLYHDVSLGTQGAPTNSLQRHYVVLALTKQLDSLK